VWTPIDIPEIKGQISAVSVPENGESLAVWTQDGVYRVRLTKDPALFHMYPPAVAKEKFDADKGLFVRQGNLFRMHGECPPGGRIYSPATSTTHPDGSRLFIDPERKCVIVHDAAEREILRVGEFDPTDCLAVVGFSRNYSGSFLVVCNSRRLRVYRYATEETGAAAKWQQSGGKPNRDALMAGILADPDNDLPRLVYADWLEEHGDPERADFLRLQCRIAERHRSEAVSADDADRLRVADLLTDHQTRWVAELPKFRGISWSATRWWRGFPSITVFNVRSLTTQLKKLSSVTPVESICAYSLQTAGSDISKLANAFRSVRRLEVRPISGEPSIANLRPLLESGALNRLRHLTVQHTLLGSEVAEILATSGGTDSLESLTFELTQITDDGALRLARSNCLPVLKSLEIRRETISDRTIEMLRSRFENVSVSAK
jgi:uncharacterized protein (TIGR02996 family)